MRKLLWVLVVVLILWCVWWAVAAFGLRTAIGTWFEDRRVSGWQAETSAHAVAGFPLRIESDMAGVALAHPDRGIAVNIPRLQISAPTWWPGDVTVAFTDDPMRVATVTDKADITAQMARADLRLHPGTRLELEAMSLTSGPWQVAAPEGGLYQADRLTVHMTQSLQNADTYHFFAKAPGFVFGSETRKRLRIPADWPVAFERMEFDATISFDRPWDLRALEERSPQPRRISLKLAEAAWGNLRLFAAADLEVDDAGVPTGTVNLQAENWQTMLDVAQAAGVLPDALRDQAQERLGLLARMSGDPTALDVQLNLRGGFMAVGIIPIGPAPRILLP